MVTFLNESLSDAGGNSTGSPQFVAAHSSEMTGAEQLPENGRTKVDSPPIGWRIILTLLAIWSAINGVIYAFDFQKRYRAEAAWLLFGAAIVIASTYSTLKHDQRSPVAKPLHAPLSWLVVALAAGFLLYWPVLGIGLLSDDFVLLDRAERGVLIDLSWEYLRPLPLAVWRAMSLQNAAEASLMLHAVNVGSHSINAWLIGIVATRIGLTPREALSAAALFLTFPGAVEPVSWISGVFDIYLAGFILASTLIATSPECGRSNVVLLALLTALALATKETAVILPMLLAISAFLVPVTSRKNVLVAIACSVVLTMGYIVIRITSGFATTPPMVELSGYVIKELITRPFGFLGLPFHVDYLESHRWLPVLFALVWPALFAGSAWRWWSAPREAKLTLLLCLWVLVTVAPLATMFFVGSDLQGSRYLYAASIAWSLIVPLQLRAFSKQWTHGAVVVVLLINIMAVNYHQQSWIEAAAERDRILEAYLTVQCRPTEVRGLPDHVRGAYVFRNGFKEATSVPALLPDDTGCVLLWDNGTFRVNDTERQR